MSTKTLTAKVRFDTRQAENSLDRLVKKINRIDRILNRGKQSGLEKSLNRATRTAPRLKQQIDKVNAAQNKLNSNSNKLATIYNKIRSAGANINKKIQNWWSSQRRVTSETRATSTALGSVWGKLKAIAATYLGIMGMRSMVQTSDIITSAENKLNYLNNGNTDMTHSSMDKMYASAQKVRMSYTDMLSNVSKSMTLAGEAFDNNIDNAIRFQEIMAEAYAVGGASAAEMSSSMYQMIQALGAGTLAGDELRSVREGAPLAYKAIEEFAQGVYKTQDSLKDLASEGMITSEMVVAAIMNAGDELDSAFAQTAQTFAQTWEQIKNVAKKAFEPVSRMLRDMLNNAIDNGLIQKFENAFVYISKGLQIIVKFFANVINWVVDNWYWLQEVLTAGILTLTALMIANAIKSAIAWLIAHWVFVLIALAIFTIIYALILWQQGTIQTTELIIACILAIAIGLFVLGMMIASVPLLIASAVLAVLALIFVFFEEVCGGVWVVVTFIGNLVQTLLNGIANGMLILGAFILNVIFSILNLIIAVVSAIITIVCNGAKYIMNIGTALMNVFKDICYNIGAFFSNLWVDVASKFWNFVGDLLSGAEKLQPLIDALAFLADTPSVSISGLAGDAYARAGAGSGEKLPYRDISTSWSEGMNTYKYKDVSDAFNKGLETIDLINYGDLIAEHGNPFGTGLSDWNISDAYNSGKDWGSGIKDMINNWGSNLTGDFTFGGLLDSIGQSLGLDFSNSATTFPNLADTMLDIGDFTTPAIGDISDGVGNISDNTGSIADSMDLAQEDLEYLRKIAAMEWKKEFTTATIKVDMSNYNTVNSDGDLDGIVTKLTDKLYEELASLADGVYV